MCASIGQTDARFRLAQRVIAAAQAVQFFTSAMHADV